MVKNLRWPDMSEKKVLIAYGTWYGSTGGITKNIAKALEKEDISSKVVNLCITKEDEWPVINNFDGVLVGSGIKVSEWTKEPLEFLKNNKDELNKDENIFGMFVCSAMSIVNPSYAKKTYLEDLAEEMGIKADVYEVLSGVFDFSKVQKIGFLEKRAIKSLMEGVEKAKGIKIDWNGKNDLRDKKQIRSFAKSFASLVVQHSKK
jgi:menaquinone-dependent protoporphyrinogen IX oxidase